MNRSTIGGLAIAASLFLTLPAPAKAADNAVGLAVSPARLDFKVPAGTSDLQSSFEVVNKGAARVSVELKLQDIVIDKAGAWQLLPAGSTPYSFPAVLTPSTLALAVGEQATIHLAAHVGSRALLGGVLVHPAADLQGSPAGTTGLQITPNLLIPLTAAPVDSSGVVEGVVLSGKAAGIKIPLFAEHGPLTLTSSVQNTGNFYERAFTTVEYSNLGRTFLTVNLPPEGTFPGGVARSSASSIVDAPGAGKLDVTPLFGIIQVRSVTHLTLLDSSAPPITQTAWVVVAPWRPIGVALAILLGVWWGARRLPGRREA